MSVYTKLNEARERFHEMKLEKTGLNKFAGYKYFELGDFIVPALQVFDKVGLCAFISFGTDLATMTIVDAGPPGGKPETITITSPMSTCEMKGLHAVQQLGAVQTYLRRYLWVAALEIVEHDALDATVGKKGDGPVIPARPPTEELGLDEETLRFIDELAIDMREMCEQGLAKEAVLKYKAAGMEGDMHIAFQNKTDSKTRTALRKASEELKAQSKGL